MSLKLDGPNGAEWSPAAPPKARVRADVAGASPALAARVGATSRAASYALAYLGYHPVPVAGGEADLVVSASPGEGARLLVGPVEAADGVEPGRDAPAFYYLCLKTGARKPLVLSLAALGSAKREAGELWAAAAAHASVSVEPSSRGFAGYQLRLREALSKGLDSAEALATLWDGLRPGALSPGSRAALLRAALPALGLFPNSEAGGRS